VTRRVPIALAAVALATVPAALAAAPAQRIVPVAFVGSTQLTTVEAPLVLEDTGTVKGSPVGSGDIVLDYTLRPKRSIANVAWTITNGSGTVTGTATAYYTTSNVAITFTGAGRITGGTGRYAGIRSLPLQFNAKHSKTGKKEAISFRGTATLPR
jgi:hypothetical protein